MEYYNNIQAVEFRDISDIICAGTFNSLCSRGQVERLRRAHYGYSALYSVESFPLKYRKAIKEKFSEEMKEDATTKLLDAEEIKTDMQAVKFYSEYVLTDGRHLPSDKQTEYTNNVSILNRCKEIYQISCERRNRTRLITDDMFRRVGAGVGYDGKSWCVVETRGFKRMTALLNDTKENSLVIAVKGEAGCGKTEAIKTFTKKNENVYNLSCSEFWNRKFFMTELLRVMGKDSSGITVGEMMTEIVDSLRHKDKPVVILDEADKLNDTVLYFFISLYNQLEDHCGLVLCATDFLEKRVKRGVRLNKKGYKEIYSRIGRKFIEMQNINANDISAVCKANGIEDITAIKDIIEDSEGDLRRVKRRIHALLTVAPTGNKTINGNTKN